MGQRPDHGTYACAMTGCKKPECDEARFQYNKRRRLKIARGEPTSTLVDASSYRRKIDKFVKKGMPVAAIARSLGVPSYRVKKLLGNVPSMPMSQRIEADLARRIEALEFDELARMRGVDSTGTRRRMQAMVWQRWQQKDLATAIGVSNPFLTGILNGSEPSVAKPIHDRARAFFARNWTVDGGCQASRDRAIQRQYAPPGAWDGAAIDDPQADPEFGVAPELAHLNPLVVIEVELLSGDRRAQLAVMARHGVMRHEGMQILGITGRPMTSAMARYGICLKSRPIGRPRKEQVA